METVSIDSPFQHGTQPVMVPCQIMAVCNSAQRYPNTARSDGTQTWHNLAQ